MKDPCFVTISELFLVLSAYTLDEIIDDVRNKERIQTVTVRTITPDSVFVCLSLVATLFFMFEQG
jgi:hypothetical protein